MVMFCYSLWSCSLWSCFVVHCHHTLLLLMVKFCYSLWSSSTIPCGCTLLLLVVTFCYLWSHFATPCGRTCSLWTCSTHICLSLLLVGVFYYSSWFHLVCYFCDKIIDYDEKIIFPTEAPLTMEFCASTSYLPSTSTSHSNNFASTSRSELWALFVNNRDF
jgi:hypothetical protein